MKMNIPVYDNLNGYYEFLKKLNPFKVFNLEHISTNNVMNVNGSKVLIFFMSDILEMLDLNKLVHPGVKVILCAEPQNGSLPKMQRDFCFVNLKLPKEKLAREILNCLK